MHDDLALAWLRDSAAAVDRLIEIDRRSRVMLTFMTSHMKEVTGPLGVAPTQYFRSCYAGVAREFFQAAENSFVTHHGLRVLFWHWMDELERLRAGAVGRRLAEHGAALPVLDREVVLPGSPIVPFTYESVRESVLAGALPPPPSASNAMLAPGECTLFERDDLIFGQLELQSAADWAEEVVILWDLLRRTISLRTAAESAVAVPDARHADAAALLARRYEAWRAAHVESARLHTGLFRLFSGGMFEFVGERFSSWTISPVLMRELYVEVAVAVARLAGEGAGVPSAPETRYWRRTPWTPAWFAPGQPGLPPFA